MKSKKVSLNIKCDAPIVYSSLESLAEINQDLVNAALEGDMDAISKIADFKLKQETRLANADLIFDNLSKGVSCLSEVFKKETDFISHTAKEVKQMSSDWTKTRLADKELQHSVEQSLVRSDYELIEADVRHQRKLNLLNVEHQTNIRLIDFNVKGQQQELTTKVRHSIGSKTLEGISSTAKSIGLTLFDKARKFLS